MTMDDIDALYNIADDHEAAMLDTLRERAGLTWECRPDGVSSHWTNMASDDTCQNCGAPKPPTAADIAARLEYLRNRIHAECISMSELAELQSLADHIQPGDIELLEWAGVSEEDARNEGRI